MKELDTKEPSVVTIAKTDMDHLSSIASDFISVISEKNKNDLALQEKEIQLKEKELIHQASAFKYKFWLLAGGFLSIVSIASGMIFYLESPSLGISVLSHTGAIVGGIVAGIGYESGKNKSNT
ncbi:MAG: hypothetical protein AB2765_20360 [Candidatus Thiodiazotropha endolucinida]